MVSGTTKFVLSGQSHEHRNRIDTPYKNATPSRRFLSRQKETTMTTRSGGIKRTTFRRLLSALLTAFLLQELELEQVLQVQPGPPRRVVIKTSRIITTAAAVTLSRGRGSSGGRSSSTAVPSLFHDREKTFAESFGLSSLGYSSDRLGVSTIGRFRDDFLGIFDTLTEHWEKGRSSSTIPTSNGASEPGPPGGQEQLHSLYCRREKRPPATTTSSCVFDGRGIFGMLRCRDSATFDHSGE
ncbi:unnamed protein product [Amoebophrya sp. A120]|nr:unnamed protein product [Amoebophrya sp. A120]|eukprot:GSA120T00020469001.1